MHMMWGSYGWAANGFGSFVSLLFTLFALAVYFLPSLIAAKRRLRNGLSILVLDLFLGWTLIGWVVALAWAVSGTAARIGEADKGNGKTGNDR